MLISFLMHHEDDAAWEVLKHVNLDLDRNQVARINYCSSIIAKIPVLNSLCACLVVELISAVTKETSLTLQPDAVSVAIHSIAKSTNHPTHTSKLNKSNV